MSASQDVSASLDLAVSAAALAWHEARVVVGGSRYDCAMMYPFGTSGDAICPVCSREVFCHLGFPASGQ